MRDVKERCGRKARNLRSREGEEPEGKFSYPSRKGEGGGISFGCKPAGEQGF